MLSSIIFIVLLASAVVLFTINIKKVRRNILLGKDVEFSSSKEERLKNMLLVAFGQSKMVNRPVAGLLHILVYVGFVLINIEVLEIILDGILGTHRLFSGFFGSFYNFLIAFFEILALLVFVSVVIFWFRRNIIKVKRFTNPELRGFPFRDANLILFTEMILMTALMISNASDQILQGRNFPHYTHAGTFPISSVFIPALSGFSSEILVMIERIFWWLHIVGILAFLNYLPISKHLHILLAFPNTYFYNPSQPLGKFRNIQEVTDVVAPNFDSSYQPVSTETEPVFGAKDVFHLSWKQLLEAYTCTECGRCTSVCPQNITGKKLSPRKIMMGVRDRLEDVGKNIDANKQFVDDGKTLFDYISTEEIWACNTCNACAEECPINISPLGIIMEMRYNLVLEQSAANASLNNMFSNIENNSAPWQFSQADRLKWMN